jgi:hypothetical protein
MHSKLLWTLRTMETAFPWMEEMKQLMELMEEALSMCHSAFLLREHQQQHHHHQHQPENLRFVYGVAD